MKDGVKPLKDRLENEGIDADVVIEVIDDWVNQLYAHQHINERTHQHWQLALSKLAKDHD